MKTTKRYSTEVRERAVRTEQGVPLIDMERFVGN